jgi:hypothetical protein
MECRHPFILACSVEFECNYIDRSRVEEEVSGRLGIDERVLEGK